MTTKRLNRRQARWSEFLLEFNFQITYRPGRLGGKPDALTRRSQDLPSSSLDPCMTHQHQAVLKPHNVQPILCTPSPNVSRTSSPISLAKSVSLPSSPVLASSSTLLQALRDAYKRNADPFVTKVLSLLCAGSRHSPKISLANCRKQDGLLYFRDLLFIPNAPELRTCVIFDHHNLPTAGHAGRSKTYSLIRRRYYWPLMVCDVRQYVRNCAICARSKASRSQPPGLLCPLTVPKQRWTDISMDFVTGLPDCRGFNAILVVVDRLSKMRHFIPCTANEDGTSAEETARLFVRDIFQLHGLPRTIVSDRGPQFTSTFWAALCSRLAISPLLSTAFHLQTDGQTEVANQGLKQYLRCFASYQQDNWLDWLPLCNKPLGVGLCGAGLVGTSLYGLGRTSDHHQNCQRKCHPGPTCVVHGPIAKRSVRTGQGPASGTSGTRVSDVGPLDPCDILPRPTASPLQLPRTNQFCDETSVLPTTTPLPPSLPSLSLSLPPLSLFSLFFPRRCCCALSFAADLKRGASAMSLAPTLATIASGTFFLRATTTTATSRDDPLALRLSER